MELTDEMLQWMSNHHDEDLTKLRLRYHGRMSPEIEMMMLQMECRRKAVGKLPKILENERFVFPTALSVEQCTSELLAEEHAGLVAPGSRVLDMTCGLGVDAFTLANKVSEIIAVEINPIVARAAVSNAHVLGLDNVKVINDDSISYLKDVKQSFDYVFIDPARRGTQGERLYALGDCHPNVVELLPLIQKHARHLVIKASPMLDISKTVSELGAVNDVYAIGTVQECKELVFVVSFDNDCRRPVWHSVTLTHEVRTEVVCRQDEESSSSAFYALPAVGGYLYEPYPSVMKIGCYKLLSARYGVGKLHHDTHLYVSDDWKADFPGNKYEIIDIIPFSSKCIKRFHEKYSPINVATRNLRMSAEQLKMKLKVRDGGVLKVFGVTVMDGSRSLIVANPVNGHGMFS